MGNHFKGELNHYHRHHLLAGQSPSMASIIQEECCSQVLINFLLLLLLLHHLSLHFSSHGNILSVFGYNLFIIPSPSSPHIWQSKGLISWQRSAISGGKKFLQLLHRPWISCRRRDSSYVNVNSWSPTTFSCSSSSNGDRVNESMKWSSLFDRPRSHSEINKQQFGKREWNGKPLLA